MHPAQEIGKAVRDQTILEIHVSAVLMGPPEQRIQVIVTVVEVHGTHHVRPSGDAPPYDPAESIGLASHHHRFVKVINDLAAERHTALFLPAIRGQIPIKIAILAFQIRFNLIAFVHPVTIAHIVKIGRVSAEWHIWKHFFGTEHPPMRLKGRLHNCV